MTQGKNQKTQKKKKMAEIIENENLQEIENILRMYECDDSISLNEIKSLPGTQQGDNWMSVVKRVIVDGTYTNEKLREW